MYTIRTQPRRRRTWRIYCVCVTYSEVIFAQKPSNCEKEKRNATYKPTTRAVVVHVVVWGTPRKFAFQNETVAVGNANIALCTVLIKDTLINLKFYHFPHFYTLKCSMSVDKMGNVCRKTR